MSQPSDTKKAIFGYTESHDPLEAFIPRTHPNFVKLQELGLLPRVFKQYQGELVIFPHRCFHVVGRGQDKE
jgi:hypothetical protein